MVTRVITYLAADIFVVIKENTFPLPDLGNHPFSLTTLNRCESRGSNEIFFFTSPSKNVSIARHWASLAIIPLLDFVMIQ